MQNSVLPSITTLTSTQFLQTIPQLLELTPFTPLALWLVLELPRRRKRLEFLRKGTSLAKTIL
jgi:hypothetical protein